jgi:Uma2 family endonuclease
MSAVASPVGQSGKLAKAGVGDGPVLDNGDRLTRDEFERRYHRMPGVKKAELIEGIVFMPSPARLNRHSEPHAHLAGWLVNYAAKNRSCRIGDNATVRLDHDNEFQPDLVLFKTGTPDAQARVSEDDYLEGPPELAVEVAASSASKDLHLKKDVYRRNGVREYLVWVTEEERVVWWELAGGEYVEIQPEVTGILKSRVFPGLWLDVPALLAGDIEAVLATLQRGLAERA